jgi:hypothetical protein
MRCEHCRGWRDGPPHVRPTGHPQDAHRKPARPSPAATAENMWRSRDQGGRGGYRRVVTDRLFRRMRLVLLLLVTRRLLATPPGVPGIRDGGRRAERARAGASARGQHRHHDGAQRVVPWLMDGRRRTRGVILAAVLVAAAWLTAMLGGTHPTTRWVQPCSWPRWYCSGSAGRCYRRPCRPSSTASPRAVAPPSNPTGGTFGARQLTISPGRRTVIQRASCRWPPGNGPRRQRPPRMFIHRVLGAERPHMPRTGSCRVRVQRSREVPPPQHGARRQSGRVRSPARNSGPKDWTLVSCQRGSPITESNLSLHVPAQVAADMGGLAARDVRLATRP